MQDKPAELLQEVASYYAGRLAQHGQTAQGVDWKDEGGQVLRFEQLARVIAPGEPFSLTDLGCGYGALFEFLQTRYPAFSYLGVDVAEEMAVAARERHAGQSQARFLAASEPDQLADYGVASGIFNVRLGRGDAEWQAYLETTLDVLDRTSRRGFAFNCLTSYSDADRMRPDLYYADPCRLFDLCKRRYSRQVALLHDYGLYEFTILVRKQQ
ncbi:class I SAM-dependent methyltransferase [Ramlibacter sp. G-1-2-2]|uniref:Class I SAM-dependent methyltransferase n=1 Tax=Ramlibacter agri TaxID=2728837 RepID=A0A848HBF3_9BURK|nr:class I SAM-dependent methyltransferase [Ramlibacter agri]NML47787.1 class I SAM-dependent methyltransferase [Ramlibacter agri]